MVSSCSDTSICTKYDCGSLLQVLELSVLLQHVATARGKLRPGGTADTVAAARVVLADWNDGRIRFYTEPPQRSSGGHDGAAIVKDWAADFNADQVGTLETSAIKTSHLQNGRVSGEQMLCCIVGHQQVLQ